MKQKKHRTAVLYSLLKPILKISLCCWLGLLPFSFVIAQDYPVTDFGAKGDGSTVNTASIQQAIDKAALKGGTVVVPAGIYMTGTIVLKSNVTLQLNKNAVIKGLAKPDAYPSQTISYPLLSNSPQWSYALVYAGNAENIAIKGEGTIDGNGADTVFYYHDKMTKNVKRPFVLLIVGCRNVTVSGITLLNSAMWMQRYIACDFLRLKDLTVFNHVNANNDGMDIDDCHNVVVSDCIIDADDDALCFKSEGERGVRNVVVTNCILSTHASAFKMGTGSTGGFQSVQFSNTVIRPSLATNLVHPFKQKGGLTGIDLASVDGGLLKDINIQNISIDGLQNPIFVKLGNRLNTKKKENAGVVEGLHFSQITVKNAGAIASAITGFPGNYVKDISFRDIFIEHNGTGTAKDTSLVVPENSTGYPGCRMFNRKLPATGFYVRHVKNIQFNNIQVKLKGEDKRPALVCDDVTELDVAGVKYVDATGALPDMMVIANSGNAVIQCRQGEEKRIRQINSNEVVIKQ